MNVIQRSRKEENQRCNVRSPVYVPCSMLEVKIKSEVCLCSFD
jgi:hypothetical protein